MTDKNYLQIPNDQDKEWLLFATRFSAWHSALAPIDTQETFNDFRRMGYPIPNSDKI